MAKARFGSTVSLKRRLLAGVVAFVPVAAMASWQTPMQPANRHATPSMRFRQDARQQKTRDDLQKSQLEQQLHKSVSDTARRATTEDPLVRARRDQAAQAQRARDRAALQGRVEQERDADRATRTVPKPRTKPNDRGG